MCGKFINAKAKSKHVEHSCFTCLYGNTIKPIRDTFLSGFTCTNQKCCDGLTCSWKEKKKS